MDVGLQMVFTGFGWDGISDQQVWDEELKLAGIQADASVADKMRQAIEKQLLPSQRQVA